MFFFFWKKGGGGIRKKETPLLVLLLSLYTHPVSLESLESGRVQDARRYRWCSKRAKGKKEIPR